MVTHEGFTLGGFIEWGISFVIKEILQASLVQHKHIFPYEGDAVFSLMPMVMMKLAPFRLIFLDMDNRSSSSIERMLQFRSGGLIKIYKSIRRLLVSDE